MSTAPDHRRVSLEEYLAWEERSESKHEYYRGEIFAMPGATVNHNRIAINILASLHGLLQGKPCEPFGSDMRVRVNAADLSTYPDISVVCDGVQLDVVDKHAIVNPRVIVEILSKSTENYDRGPKFELYQQLDSFAEYVVVYQSEAKVVHYVRQDDGDWRYRLVVGMESNLELDSIGCTIPFSVIYRNVEFQPEIDDPAKTPRRPREPRE